MHKRDYLLKQFEEFGKVMAILIGLKREGSLSELSELINESLKKYTATEIEYIETLTDDELLNTLTIDKKLNDEQLKMLADLIFEKGEYYSNTEKAIHPPAINCYKKAFLIYLFLKENATLTYSLDMHYKIEILSKMGL